MPFSDLTLDPAFVEFNFSWVFDPTLSGGPSQASLLQLVYEARQGDRSAIFEFVDAICCTLPEETFDCFQKVHGPRPIRYRDWYYQKLHQFLELLVYEKLSYGAPGEPQTDRPWEEGMIILGSAGPPVQDDDVERAFEPGHNDPSIWSQLRRGDLGNVTEPLSGPRRASQAAQRGPFVQEGSCLASGLPDLNPPNPRMDPERRAESDHSQSAGTRRVEPRDL